ncbi:MAG: MlaD family protein [Tibeticola sp.]
MENKAHALAAGTFVLVVSLLLVALGWWLSREGGVRTTYELSSPNGVSGLNLQAAVRYKGVPVGKVTGIGFDPKQPGSVLIRISVDEKAPITRSTWATLGYQGVTGIAHIALDDDGKSTEPLTAPEGEVPRIPLRPGLLGQFSDEGQRLLAQVQEAARRINALMAPENQQALLRAVNNAADAAAGFRRLSDDLHVLMVGGKAAGGTSVPELAQQTRATLQALQQTLQETRATVAEAGKTVQALGAKGGAADQLGESARALADLARALEADTVPRVNQLAEDGARASRELSRAASALGENPQALIWGHGTVPPGPGEPGYRTAPAR